MNTSDKTADAAWDRRFMVLVLMTVVGALALRVWGIDVRSFSHVEVYIPGIPLPEGISEPPPRHGLIESIHWNYYSEPHPGGWYLLMFGWAKLFGTSEFALRLPSAIFGSLSVAVVALIGRRLYSSQVGLLAGLLLALHGFHIYWSQIARMYTAGALLALLTTYFLIRLCQEEKPNRGLVVAYLVSAFGAFQCVDLFWPTMLFQVLWVILKMPVATPAGSSNAVGAGFFAASRVLQLQAVVLILAAPNLQHSVFQARGGAAQAPSLQFLVEYFGFGFLFADDLSSIPVHSVGPVLLGLVALGGVALLVLGLRAVPRPFAFDPRHLPGLPFWVPLLLAIAVSVLMVWLGSTAFRRGPALTAMAVLPLMALALPLVARTLRAVLAAVPPFARRIESVPPGTLLLAILAVVTPLALVLASFVIEVLAEYAFTMFLPYLLILVAAGLLSMWRVRAAGVAGSLVVLTVFALSVPFAYKIPGSPRDYKALAHGMATSMKPDDIVLVRHRDWEDTPIFYYLPDARYVTTDYAKALASSPGSRVWIVTWGVARPTDPRHEAVATYAKTGEVTALRGLAELYEHGG